MRKSFIALVILAGLAALAVAVPAQSATIQVAIKRGGFAPATISVTAGDTVTWLNADTQNHQVVADDSRFASPILQPGQSFSQRFDTTGSIGYRDGLNTRERGRIVVKAAPIPDAVTLATSGQYIKFGDQVRLTGTVSTARPNETVTLWAQPYGQSSYAQVGTVVSGTGGAWDFLVKPEILTNYQARFRNALSPVAMVQVQPKITFMVSRGVFTARVYGNRSFEGRWLYVQQRSSLGQWISLKKVFLNDESTALFRMKLKVKVSHPLRMFMTVNQAGVGYLATNSGTQTVVRRCSSGAPAC